MRKYNFLMLPFLLILVILPDGMVHTQPFPQLEIEWQPLILSGRSDFADWSPDSQYLAYVTSKGKDLSIFNVQNRTVEHHITLSDVPSTDDGSIFVKPIWSPEGDYIAATGTVNTVYTINVKTAQIIHVRKIDHNIIDIRWLDNQSVAALNPSGYVDIYDAITGQAIDSFHLDTTVRGILYTAFDWNPRDQLFAIPIYITNSVGFWTADGMLVGNYRLDGRPEYKTMCLGAMDGIQISDIKWSTDGRKLAIVARYGISVCERGDDYTAQTQFVEGGGGDIATWSPDGRWLLTTSTANPSCPIYVFDAENDYQLAQTIQEPGLCAANFSFSWSPDGKFIFAGTSLGIVRSS